MHGASCTRCLGLSTSRRTSVGEGSPEQVVKPKRGEESPHAREEEAVVMSNWLVMGELIKQNMCIKDNTNQVSCCQRRELQIRKGRKLERTLGQ